MIGTKIISPTLFELIPLFARLTGRNIYTLIIWQMGAIYQISAWYSESSLENLRRLLQELKVEAERWARLKAPADDDGGDGGVAEDMVGEDEDDMVDGDNMVDKDNENMVKEDDEEDTMHCVYLNTDTEATLYHTKICSHEPMRNFELQYNPVFLYIHANTAQITMTIILTTTSIFSPLPRLET